MGPLSAEYSLTQGSSTGAAGRHRFSTEPDPNYHGLHWALDLPAPLAPH